MRSLFRHIPMILALVSLSAIAGGRTPDSTENPEFFKLKLEVERHLENGEPEKALEKSPRLMRTANGDSSLIAISHFLKGVAFLDRSRLDSSLTELLEAFKYFMQLNDEYYLGETHFELAYWMVNRRRIKEAKRHYETSISYFEKVGWEKGILKAKGNLALLHASQGGLDEARGTFFDVLRLAKKKQDTSALLPALLNIGRVHFKKGALDSALHYFEKGIVVAEEHDDPLLKADGIRGIADIHARRGSHDTAISHWKEALEIYKARGQYPRAYSSYRRMIRSMEAIGNYKSANNYLREYWGIRDSIHSIEREVAIAQLRDTLAMVQQEARIDLLEAKNRSEEMKNSLYLALLLLVLAISIAVTVGFRHQRKLRRVEKQMFQKDLEVEEAKNEQLRIELDLKSRSLTKEGLRIIQKNHQLKELQEKLDDLSKKVPEKAKVDLREVGSAIRNAFRVEKDWEEFSIYFEEVHPSFFQNLNKFAPKLSPKEKRLCALLKVNMNTKEIASVLGISPDSVKKARTRLRKKLPLKEGEDLGRFVGRM